VRRYFSLKPLLIITVLGLVAALIGAIGFAWSSPASKPIALTTAALLGAATLFLLQLRLELRGSEESDLISVEYVIDRAKPEVSQFGKKRITPKLALLIFELRSGKLITLSLTTKGHCSPTNTGHVFLLAPQ
jgi:hypothetical protein